MERITVDIEGMACGMCEAHINEAVGNGIQGVMSCKCRLFGAF